MTSKNGTIEVRWHGRGGQGAVTSAELIAKAAINEGKYAQAFPAFGAERRGAPVLAFDRVNDKLPIRVRADVTEPDIVVVLDSSLLNIVNVTAGLKKGGILVINSSKPLDEAAADYCKEWRVAVIDASRIARELLGVPIVNTTMLGAVLKATELVKMESLVEPLKERFGRLAEKNIEAMKRAYKETATKECSNGKS